MGSGTRSFTPGLKQFTQHSQRFTLMHYLSSCVNGQKISVDVGMLI